MTQEERSCATRVERFELETQVRFGLGHLLNACIHAASSSALAIVRPLMALPGRGGEETFDLIAFVGAGQSPVPRLLQLLHAAAVRRRFHSLLLPCTLVRALAFICSSNATALPAPVDTTPSLAEGSQLQAPCSSLPSQRAVAACATGWYNFGANICSPPRCPH